MGSHFFYLVILVLVTFLELSECSSKGDKIVAPAIYVFGDSLVDVGNNNYLDFSVAKADFPHNGMDFPTKQATGRFSNGKNAADFLSEKLGLPTSPPYLSLTSNSNKGDAFLNGVSFASGGAGIFNGTDLKYKQSIPLTLQVSYYSTVYQEILKKLGPAGAKIHLSKSIFTIVIGSNDIFGYFNSKSDAARTTTPEQQYVDQMVLALKVQLKLIYGFGGRKFVVTGLGPIGCCPKERHENSVECNEEANKMAELYNAGLKSMLQDVKSEHNDINYTYFDTYPVLLSFIQTPASYGFTEVKAACCGLGDLNANIPCIPIAEYCSNRSNHVFWDLFHPTEASARIFVDKIYDGPRSLASPINVVIILTLMFNTPLRKLVVVVLDQSKRGKGPVVAKTVAATMILVFISTLHGILKVQTRSSDGGLVAVNPTDQVLLAYHILEASLMGFFLFLALMVDRFHYYIKELHRLRKHLDSIRKQNNIDSR